MAYYVRQSGPGIAVIGATRYSAADALALAVERIAAGSDVAVIDADTMTEISLAKLQRIVKRET